ncbi:GAF domain-containing protein [Xylophilus rhododendri]|uniref:histidine kinase n=1 Tax=Xylophilus rhododendri TaxID=2697032 RepID=A0A857J160_9BURK|nr:GAF domain-containing sensor histidine kinase [Xylophilus rhododendri]QHI96993.1 GAF domain-containing protein [Xylophilus rhododendri]
MEIQLNQDADRSLATITGIKVINPILEIVRAQTGMRFAAIAWVTATRWRACAVLDGAGLGVRVGDELDVDTTICKDVLSTRQMVAFDDALADPFYSTHHTPRLYGFRAYVSVPIILADGTHFGNLCALDPEPRDATSERARAVLQSTAEILARLIDEEEAISRTRLALVQERDMAGARERFLAVVAHDLRNPLFTMHTAAELMLRGAEPAAAKLGARLKSSAARMTRLIDDLVDFSRGRAGAAMTVTQALHTDLAEFLEAVVDEARDGHPDRVIESSLDYPAAVRCDPDRLQQLLSNLLGNAIAYGDARSPIAVQGFVEDGRVVLEVRNWGAVIAPEVLERVFDAFYRGSTAGDSSMGLGLNICLQIAQAHGGRLSASSSATAGTRFRLEFALDGSSLAAG